MAVKFLKNILPIFMEIILPTTGNGSIIIEQQKIFKWLRRDQNIDINKIIIVLDNSQSTNRRRVSSISTNSDEIFYIYLHIRQIKL